MRILLLIITMGSSVIYCMQDKCKKTEQIQFKSGEFQHIKNLCIKKKTIRQEQDARVMREWQVEKTLNKKTGSNKEN